MPTTCPFHAGFSAAAARRTVLFLVASGSSCAHSMRVSALLRPSSPLTPEFPSWCAHSMRVSALLRLYLSSGFDAAAALCPFHAGFSAAAAKGDAYTLLSKR